MEFNLDFPPAQDLFFKFLNCCKAGNPLSVRAEHGESLTLLTLYFTLELSAVTQISRCSASLFYVELCRLRIKHPILEPIKC